MSTTDDRPASAAPPGLDLLANAGGLTAARLARGLVSGAIGTAKDAALGLVPSFRSGDLDDRDPDYVREVLPAMWLFVSTYFRADVRGLHHIPKDGPVLIVSNHTGGVMAPEIPVFVLAFSAYFGVERPFFQLAHRLVVNSPAAPILRRFGTVEADPRNAEAALASGAAVLVFPGGDHEVFRPSWESAKIDFGGRKGWIRLAQRQGVPIVPVVTIGGQETALFLSRGEWLSRLLRLDKTFRLKTLPIYLAPPFGLVIGGMNGHIPLPAKVTLQVLPPVDLEEEFGEEPDLDEAYEAITGRMQDVLTALQEERRLPVVG